MMISIQDFLEHQEVVNASPSQEDSYISLCENLKLIAWLVKTYGATKGV
jgi:hypothetical protein